MILSSELLKRVFPLLSWAVLGLVVTARVLWVINQDLPLATDSYFYLQEIKHRLSGQGSYYHEGAFFFGLFEFAARVLHLRELASYQLMILSALAALLGAAIISVAKSGAALAPLIALPIVLFDVAFFRVYAFPRQALGTGLILLSFLWWLRAGDIRDRVIAAVMMLVAVAVHWYALFPLTVLLATQSLRRAHSTRQRGLLFLLIMIIIIGVFSFAPFKIFNMPPSYYSTTWWAACSYADCSSREYAEFLLVSILISGALIFTLLNFETTSPVLLGLLAFLFLSLMPFWNEENHLAYRLAIGALWAAPVLFGELLRIQFEKKSHAFLLLAYLMSIFITLLTTPKSYDRVDEVTYNLSEFRSILSTLLPKTAFIQAPHGLQFKITYFLDRSSGPKLPDGGNFSNIFTITRKPGNFSQKHCLKLPTTSAEQVDGHFDCVLLGETWVLSSPHRNFLR